MAFSINFSNVLSTKAAYFEGEFEVLVNNPKKIKLKTQHEGIVGFLELDKDTGEIFYKTNEKNKHGQNEKVYLVDIEQATSEGVIANFTDTDDNAEYEYNSAEATASWAFLIPLGIAIGGALIEQLIALGLAVVILGVAFIAYEEFSNKERTYTHYAAHLDTQKGILFIGNGLSLANAITRVKSGYDTWSNSANNAGNVAKGASPLGKAIGPEIDMQNGTPKRGYFYHYHVANEILLGQYTRMNGYDTNNKNGVHVFYGAPY